MRLDVNLQLKVESPFEPEQFHTTRCEDKCTENTHTVGVLGHRYDGRFSRSKENGDILIGSSRIELQIEPGINIDAQALE